MKRFLIISIVLATIFTVFAHGQKDSSFCKHSISINLSQILLADPRISYEYFLYPRQSIKVDCGYKFQIISYSMEGDYSLFDGSFSSNGAAFSSLYAGISPIGGSYNFNLNPYSYKNFSLSVGYNYFLNSKKENKQNYLSGTIMYKNNFNKNIVLVGGEDGYYYYTLFSGYQNFYELKLLIGKRILRMKNKKISPFFIEFYTGLGISDNKGEGTITKGNARGDNSSPTYSQVHFMGNTTTETNKTENLIPRFYFGVKYGIAWKKRN